MYCQEQTFCPISCGLALGLLSAVVVFFLMSQFTIFTVYHSLCVASQKFTFLEVGHRKILLCVVIRVHDNITAESDRGPPKPVRQRISGEATGHAAGGYFSEQPSANCQSSLLLI